MSATDVTVAVVSFHPTTTTFRSPAPCAAAYFTATAACGDCGSADATCTKAIAAGGGGVSVVALATLE